MAKSTASRKRMLPWRRREQFERVARHRAIVAGALDRVLERAMLFHGRQREFEIAVDDFALFQGAAPEFALVRRPAPERQHDGQGDLALAKVVADILAELGRRAAVVERIVDELKGDAEIGAEAPAGGDLRLRAAGENGPDLAGRRE